VDRDKLTPAQAAAEFLAAWVPSAGVAWDSALANRKGTSAGSVDVVIGTKNFTEQYILGQILRQLINGASTLQADLKPGLGGTAVCWQALLHRDIDLYPDYSGTLIASILKPSAAEMASLLREPAAAQRYLVETLRAQHDLEWLTPFGFNNTYTLMVRGDDARFDSVHNLSDLSRMISSAGWPSPSPAASR
jgi:osmoprotectant transport system permease protein